jgi:hypothetical protein
MTFGSACSDDEEQPITTAQRKNVKTRMETSFACSEPANRRRNRNIDAAKHMVSMPAGNALGGCIAPVEAIVITGAGHTWPGAPVMPLGARVVGPTSRQIDASREIGEFFAHAARKP